MHLTIILVIIASNCFTRQTRVLGDSVKPAVQIPSIPGIDVKVTEKGLLYLSKLTEDMLPKVFSEMSFPSFAGSGTGYSFSLQNLTIVQLSRPVLKARFTNSGINITGRLQRANLSAEYTAYALGWGGQGEVSGAFRNVTLQSLLSIISSKKGSPQVFFNACSIMIGDDHLEFTGMSWFLQSAISMIKKSLRARVGNMLCSVIQKALSHRGEGGSGSMLCGDTDSTRSRFSSEKGGRKSSPGPLEPMAVNMSMVENPKFSPDHLGIEFNGTTLYHGHASYRSFVRVKPDPYPVDGGKMLRIGVSSMVPNSFFSHVFAYSLAKMHKKTGLDAFPTLIRKPLKLLCPRSKRCATHFHAGLTRAPTILIRKGRKGVRINIHGRIRTHMYILGRRTDIFWAETLIRVKAYPYVRNDRLHARTTIDQIFVTTNPRVGLIGTIFGILVKDAANKVNHLVPLQITGDVKRALRRIFGPKGGIPLPQACGVRFVGSRLRHLNNVIVIDTEMEYNTARLVRQFRQLIGKANDAKRNDV